MNALVFIFKNLSIYRARFIVIFIMGILDGAALFAIPVLLAEFTKTNLDTHRFIQLAIAVLCAYVLSLILQWFIRNYGEAMAQQFANHIRLVYFRKLVELPPTELKKYHSGYTLSLINNVSEGMTPILFSIFWTVALSTSNLILFFYFTARESFLVACVNFLTLSIFIIASVLLSRKMIPITQELNARRASLFERYADFMANIITVQRLNVVDFAYAKIADKTLTHNQQISQLQKFHANRWAFLHSLFGFAFLSTIGFLLLQISRGVLSPSVLILFIAAYAIIRGNIERLSEYVKDLMVMNGYIQNLDEVLMQVLPVKNGTLPLRWQEMSLKDVQLHLQDATAVISIPALTLQKGKIISLTGASGQGKTTVLNILMNNVQPSQGERYIDGIEFKSIDPDFFRQHITYISQETELFNLSVRDNLTLGVNIPEVVLEKTLTDIGLGEWYRQLTDGFETIVGEKGVKMSAGQKQRLNIARGVLLDRDIVLLDEPTSHLDEATEQVVVKYLQQALKNKTVVIVTHRSAVEELSHRRYVMTKHSLQEIQ